MTYVLSRSWQLDLDPRPKERPRFAAFGGKMRTYTPAATQASEDEIRYLVMASRVQHPMAVPLRLRAMFYLRRPASSGRRWPISGNRTEGDIDQYVKLLMDALTGLVWEDDNQIVELAARKAWADERDTMGHEGKPGIDIVIEYA